MEGGEDVLCHEHRTEDLLPGIQVKVWHDVSLPLKFLSFVSSLKLYILKSYFIESHTGFPKKMEMFH